MGELGEMLSQAAFKLFVAAPVAPVGDKGFESVVDARKLVVAWQPPVAPVAAHRVE